MMRRPQEIKVRPGAQKSAATSIPAPIGGLNARDSIANMDDKDAVLMENFFPKTTSVDVRNGYTAWSTFTGVCQSILVYAGNTATSIFSCVKNGGTYSIFNSTSSGAVGAAVVGGGGATVEALTTCRFDHVNFGTTGGQFLSVVNGSDAPLQYDGTTWTVSTMTGGTPANLFTVGVYSSRLWYAQKDSMNVWYQVTSAITGALTQYNLGMVFKLGGYINSIITVTDSANTLADYIVFLSSEGELVAYTGDPGGTFTRVAQFRLGRPVIKGNRCWAKWGSDALVLCADGVFPIRQAIQADSRNEGLAVSDKIRNLINGDIQTYGGLYGWDITLHPTGAKLVVNTPTAEDTTSYQYVMNTQTGAWTKFLGWTAFCFETARDTLWMGGSGTLVKADLGTYDGATSITTDVRQAYNYYGNRGYAKHMKLLRPVIASDGGFQIGVHIDIDYEVRDAVTMQTISGGAGDPWAGIWDVTWSGAAASQTRWYGVKGIGHAIATRIKTVTGGVSLSWSATDAVYEKGGILA
jgi:hypothetical protein